MALRQWFSRLKRRCAAMGALRGGSVVQSWHFADADHSVLSVTLTPSEGARAGAADWPLDEAAGETLYLVADA
jgi:hypothetical protein